MIIKVQVEFGRRLLSCRYTASYINYTTTYHWPREWVCNALFSHIVSPALDKLGFGDYRAEAEAVVKDCKAMAAKKRRKSTRLENLGIPEEELLRQQQELFAKVGGSLVRMEWMDFRLVWV